MAEVDRILLLQLGDIGVSVDGGVKSAADFDPSLFYGATRRCLELVTPESAEQLPRELPTGMSSRFRACGALAAAVLGTGYHGDLSFNQFMYPSPQGVRSVLSWLGQLLPGRQEDAASPGSPRTGAVASAWERLRHLAQAAAKRSRERLSASQSLFPVLLGEYPTEQPREVVSDTPVLCPFVTPQSEAEAQWCTRSIPFLADQTESRIGLWTACLEYNAAAVGRERVDEADSARRGTTSKKEQKRERRKEALAAISFGASSTQRYSKGVPAILAPARNNDDASTVFSEGAAAVVQVKTRFQKETEFAVEQVPEVAAAAAAEGGGTVAGEEVSPSRRAEERKHRAELEQKRLRAEIRALEVQLVQAESDLVTAQGDEDSAREVASGAAERARELEEEGDALERDWEQWRETLEMCGDPESRRLLEGTVSEERETLALMREEWAQREAKYKSRHDALEAAIRGARSDEDALLEEIEANRRRLKQLKVEAKQKEALREQLKHELELCPKDIDREEFLRRIFDLIKNVHKQQAEVEKITKDTRKAKQDIEGLNSELETVFSGAQEKCYKEVKQDSNEAGRAVYRQLIALREAFDGLVSCVKETGEVKQSIHEHEEKNEKLQARNEGLSESQVEDDLKQLRDENEELNAEVKQARARLKALADK